MNKTPSLIFGSLCILFALFYIPWIPTFFFLTPSVDESWLLTLHYFFEVKKQFGSEVIFTYGPYGFLMGAYYYPATFAVLISVYSLFFLVFIESLWGLLGDSIPNIGIRALLAASILFFSGPPADSYFFLICIVAFLSFDATENRVSSPRNCFLTIALAIISLIKFSFVLLIFPIFILSAMESLLRRRIPWLGILFILAYLSFWGLASQSFSNLWDYFRNSWDLTLAYTGAMATPAAPVLRMMEIFYLLGTLLLIFVITVLKNKTSRYLAIKHGLFFALVGFLVFKTSYVLKNEYHAIIAAMFLPAVALLYFSLFYNYFSTHLWKALFLIALSSALVVFFRYSFLFNTNPLRSLSHNASLLPARIRLLSSKNWKDLHQEFAAAFSNQHSFKQVPGSADVYSYWQMALLANNLRYHPRPVFQDYAAYTPRLAALNANFLKRPDAPDFIFLSIDSLTALKRMPALTDGLSWPEIATHYFPLQNLGETLLLKKDSVTRRNSLTPLYSVTARWNEDISIPRAPVRMWATVKIKSTWRNKLLSLVYRPLVPQLRFIRVNKKGDYFNIVPPLAEAGFLVSPLVDSPTSFLTTFYGRNLAAVQDLFVAKIRFFTPDGFPAEKFFEDKIEVSFFALEIKSQKP